MNGKHDYINVRSIQISIVSLKVFLNERKWGTRILTCNSYIFTTNKDIILCSLQLTFVEMITVFCIYLPSIKLQGNILCLPIISISFTEDTLNSRNHFGFNTLCTLSEKANFADKKKNICENPQLYNSGGSSIVI